MVFPLAGGGAAHDEHPGFKEFILAPSVPEGLEKLNCCYNSPAGSVSNWTRLDRESIRYEMLIPEGTLARVNLELGERSTISIEKDGNKLDPGKIEGLQDGLFELGEGEYLHHFVLTRKLGNTIQILSYLPAVENNH